MQGYPRVSGGLRFLRPQGSVTRTCFKHPFLTQNAKALLALFSPMADAVSQPHGVSSSQVDLVFSLELCGNVHLGCGNQW